MAATWKKVIVSGSSAELANVNVDSALRVSGSVAVSTTAGAIVNQIGSTQATTFLSGSFTGSFTGAHTGSLFGTASQALSASYIIGGISAQVFPYTGSAQFTGSLGVTGSLTVSGSMTIVGRATVTDLTGSLFGTASQALTASYIIGGIAAQVFPYTGSAQFTGSVGITGSLNVSGAISGLLPNASTAYVVTYNNTSGVLGYTNFGGLTAVSSSYAATASYATQTIAALSQGTGITAFSYNGSSSVAVSVSGAAALSANSLPKWTGAGFSNSNITDTGTAISVASNVPVTVNSNLTVTGDLTVAGTASFQNTENVLIGDRFIVLASGSTSLTDGGLIIATSTAAGGISGSAFFIDAGSAGSTGLYGRFAVAQNIPATASSVTADEFVVSAKINQASNPAAAPTWGSGTNGSGNLWVTNAGDIFIYG